MAVGSGTSPTGIGTLGHTLIVQDFAAAIREGRDPLVDGVEGRRSLALVLAISRPPASARRGRRREPRGSSERMTCFACGRFLSTSARRIDCQVSASFVCSADPSELFFPYGEATGHILQP